MRPARATGATRNGGNGGNAVGAKHAPSTGRVNPPRPLARCLARRHRPSLQALRSKVIVVMLTAGKHRAVTRCGAPYHREMFREFTLSAANGLNMTRMCIALSAAICAAVATGDGPTLYGPGVAVGVASSP